MKHLSNEFICQVIEQAIPFNRWLELQVISCEPGEVRVRLPFKPELIGDPVREAMHGGVISALLDATAGAAVFTLLAPPDRAATLDMRVDFLRPGRKEALLCKAKVVRLGHRVAVVHMSAWHEGQDHELIASGVAVFNVRRRSPREQDPPESQG